MTIRESLNQAISLLSKSRSTSPVLDAEVLLLHVLNKPKEYIFLNPDKALTASQQAKFSSLVKQRRMLWPVAYITGTKSFMGRDFHVNQDVLIPRPVTEELVEMVLQKMNGKNLSVLDIGTGSGCIIVSLAKSTKGKFFASDISAEALKVARKNAKIHKAKITFKEGSLLNPWRKQHLDIIVTNLPYLAKETDPSTKFEPKLALVAKKKGLALYEELFQQIPTSAPDIFLEIGHDQGKSITALAKKYLPSYGIKILKDFTGRTRFAILQQKTRH